MGEVIQMRKDETKVTNALDELMNYIKSLEAKVNTLIAENEKLKEVNPFTKEFDALPDVLVAEDIARYLRKSRYTVYEYLKISPEHGGIKSFEAGRSIRCMKSDFAQWLIDQKEKKAHGVRKNAREK